MPILVKFLAVRKTDPFWKALEFSLIPYLIVSQCQNTMKSPERLLTPTRIQN